MPHVPLQGVDFGNVVATLSLAADAVTPSLTLFAYGMPYILFWCNQTLPVAASPVTIQVQYALRPTTGVQRDVTWLSLDTPQLLVPGQPTRFAYVVPCVYVRATFTRVAGVASTVEYNIGCSAVGG